MVVFNTRTVKFGPSVYLLVPAAEAEKHNINEGDFFQITLQRLIPEVPREEVDDAE